VSYPTNPRQIEESSVSAPVNLEDTQIPDTSRPQPESTTGLARMADMAAQQVGLLFQRVYHLLEITVLTVLISL
jgi:hypothetical protein